MPKIEFHSNKIYNKKKSDTSPVPAKKEIPKWFTEASRYWFPDNEEFLSFKTCPALIDAFLSGYVLRTPCDIKISIDKKNKNFIVDVPDLGYKDFCEKRSEIPFFPKPFGFSEAFHWYPNWMPGLDSGYSALYIHPINRYDLPFITVSGIIDSDKANTPGLIPFFLKDNFEGVISKGTPFIQIIPFKREEWESDEILYSMSEISERHDKQASMYRIPGGGGYKKNIWSKKVFN